MTIEIPFSERLFSGSVFLTSMSSATWGNEVLGKIGGSGMEQEDHSVITQRTCISPSSNLRDTVYRLPFLPAYRNL